MPEGALRPRAEAAGIGADENRAPWTPHLLHGTDITAHLYAWQELLCMVAGLSGMRTRRFFLILAAMKPLSIFFYSLSLLLLGHLIF